MSLVCARYTSARGEGGIDARRLILRNSIMNIYVALSFSHRPRWNQRARLATRPCMRDVYARGRALERGTIFLPPRHTFGHLL